jgi:hypothetical protein
MINVPVVCNVPLRSVDLHAPALLSHLEGGKGVDPLLKGGVVSLEVLGLKVVGDVVGVDGRGEPVYDGSDKVGDTLGLDNLEDAAGRCRRDGREGSLKIVPRRWGYGARWGFVGEVDRGGGHVGDWYEEGNVCVKAAAGLGCFGR